MAWTLATCALLGSVGCATKYTAAPIDPALTGHIEPPPLRGRTWQHVYEQDLEALEALRRCNCRGYVLRKEPLPAECRADE